MAAHRYWRWYFTEASSGSFALIGEAEMMASLTGADVTGTGTASADSTFTANTQAAKAFANDGVTYYSSGDVRCQCWESTSTAYPHWLMYDFGVGNEQEIVKYTLQAADNYVYETPVSWQFQYSDNAVDWTTVDERLKYYWVASLTRVIVIGEGVSGRVLEQVLTADTGDGGAYRITGTVDELGAAGAYRVRLFDRQSGRCIRETWSAADGSYAFNNIAYRNQGYFAIAFDHGNNPLNAAIADLITPEAMP